MRKATGVAVLAVFHISQVARADHRGPCSVCPNEDDSYDPAFAKKSIAVPGQGILECGFLETIIPVYFVEGRKRCQAIQSMGTYCGCPKREDSCRGLCEEYNREATVDNFLSLGDDYQASCELVQSHLESLEEGSDECNQKIAQYSQGCKCPVDPNNIFDPSEIQEDENLDKLRGVYYSSFTLCPDGSPAGTPDLDLGSLLGNGDDSANTLVAYASEHGIQNLTCSFMDQAIRASLLPTWVAEAGDEEHLLLAGACGCPPVSNACNFCPSNDMTEPQKGFALTEVIFDVTASCEQMEDMLTQYRNTDLRCWSSKNFAFLCGCNEGTAWYLGADSETEHQTLAWIPRVTGFLSFLGSVYIIQDIVRQSRKTSIGNRFSTYHMILLGMSLFDVSSSIAWMVSTAALPKYDEERESESGVYGAKGNEATCKVQGFFLELGFVGSTAFTAVLTSFYVLTIIYGYREAKMKPLQKYFMAGPCVLAVALASAAIPYYRPFYVACLVSNPNTEVDRYADEWRYLVIFSILPIGIAILISVCNLAAILRFVIKQNQKANKWRFGSVSTLANHSSGSKGRINSTSHGSLAGEGSTSSRLDSERDKQVSEQSRRKKRTTRSQTEKAVFWQAFWYVMAFLLTWVIYLIGQFKPYWSDNDGQLYAFWITLLILNPLMGFWNAFVYVKPWTWAWKKILPKWAVFQSSKESSRSRNNASASVNNENPSSGIGSHASTSGVSSTPRPSTTLDSQVHDHDLRDQVIEEDVEAERDIIAVDPSETPGSTQAFLESRTSEDLSGQFVEEIHLEIDENDLLSSAVSENPILTENCASEIDDDATTDETRALVDHGSEQAVEAEGAVLDQSKCTDDASTVSSRFAEEPTAASAE